MDEVRYFLAMPAVIDDARARLNVELGLPADGQIAAIPRAAELPLAPDGRAAIGLLAVDCSEEPAATLLRSLLNSGAAEEIDRVRYDAIVAKEVP